MPRKTKFSQGLYCFISVVPIFGAVENRPLINFQCVGIKISFKHKVEIYFPVVK